jgi:hypothetical protein
MVRLYAVRQAQCLDVRAPTELGQYVLGAGSARFVTIEEQSNFSLWANGFNDEVRLYFRE